MKASQTGDFARPARPRRTPGGIKADSRRGEFAATWWGRRWLSVLESFDLADRLARGRFCARAGQVLDIRIRRGEVTAEVQGAPVRPFAVKLRIAPLRRAELNRLLEVLAGKAVYRARLLAGEMPEELEEAFTQSGLSLFPRRLEELMTSCSCPDWSTPCEHVAAVYYLLAGEFDRDPFLLLRLRGIERANLVEPAGGAEAARAAAGGAAAKTAARGAAPGKAGRPPAGPAAVPLPADPEIFWGHRPAPPPPAGEGPAAGTKGAAATGEEPLGERGGGPIPDAEVPPVPAALARQLGSFPFWRGEQPFLPAMEQIYQAASAAAAAAFARLAAAAPAAGPEEPAEEGSPGT